MILGPDSQGSMRLPCLAQKLTGQDTLTKGRVCLWNIHISVIRAQGKGLVKRNLKAFFIIFFHITLSLLFSYAHSKL